MKMKKTCLFLLSVLSLVLLLSATTFEIAEAASKITLRVNVQQVKEHQTAQAMMRIKKTVEEATKGGLVLDVHTDSVLGDYTVMFEEAMLGTVDMTLQSLPGQYDPRLEMTFIPYLFTNYAEAAKVFAPGSNTYNVYDKIVAGHGLKALGIFGEGFVCVATTKEDTQYAQTTSKKKLLLRVPAIETNRLIVASMNYPTVTINYSDLFSAMQTGVCDGWLGGTAENNYLNFRDIIKYFYTYNCLMENNVMLMNQKSWEKLPKEYQKILYDACIKEAVGSFKRSEEFDNKYIDLLEKAGIKVVRLTEKQLSGVAEHVRNNTWGVIEKQLGKEVMDAVRKDMKK